MQVLEADKRFIAKVYGYVFVGLMLEWIGNDMKEDPVELVDRLALVIKGDVTSALERFRTDRRFG